MLTRFMIGIHYLALIVTVVVTATVASADERKRIAAESYINSSGVQASFDQLLGKDVIKSFFSGDEKIDNLSDGQKRKLATIAEEEIAAIRPEVEEVVVEALIAQFSLEEIEMLAEFYSSEVGRSIQSKMGNYMIEANNQLAPLVRQLVKALEKRVNEEFGEN